MYKCIRCGRKTDKRDYLWSVPLGTQGELYDVYWDIVSLCDKCQLKEGESESNSCKEESDHEKVGSYKKDN